MNEFAELLLQKKIYKYLSNPAEVLSTFENNRIQVLSIGTINKHKGPDFKDIAILLNGQIIVGNAEFHRKSSDWYKHNHQNNSDFSDIILHIVFEIDNTKPNIETLVLDEVLINKIIIDSNSESEDDNRYIDELQNFALLRLLRKSSDTQVLLDNNSLTYSLKESVRAYCERYLSRQRRPIYNSARLLKLIDNLEFSSVFHFLSSLNFGDIDNINEKLLFIMKTPIFDEGAHFRREIILNCILPLAICLAPEKVRIDLLYWFWSTPALTNYGKLSGKFPSLPQKYLWQQQGMLEYMRLHGNKKNADIESVNNFKFAEILNFFSYGNG